MVIKITVWVPENGSLSNLTVGTVQLGVLLLDNLSIDVSAYAKLNTVTGKIVAASAGSETRDESLIDVGAPDSFQLRSRFIEAKSTSGDIMGSWPLYDYLGVQSVSGNIKACIEPREADKDAPKPAILYLRSMSGNIEFREPIHAAEEAIAVSRAQARTQAGIETDLRAEAVLTPRDYRVDVHSTSGDLRGAVAFSSICSFKTTSGKTTVDVLPVLDSSLAEEHSKEVMLSTSSTSGNTYLTLLEPLWVDSEKGQYVDLPSAVRDVPPAAPPPSKPDEPRYIPIDDNDPYSWLPWAHRRAAAGGPSQPVDRTAATARALRNLHSDHSATSADVHLRFPAVWEGDVSMSAMSGRLKARGEGLRIVREGGGGWPRKQLFARKGEEGGSRTTVHVTSGDVDFVVGKD